MQSRLPEFTHPPGPETIAAFGSRTFAVTFSPVVGGAYRDTLFIASNDRENPLVPVVLIGNSQNLPDIQVRDLQVSENPVFLNKSATISAVIENLAADVAEAFAVSIIVDGQTVFDSTISGMAINESFTIQTTLQFNRAGDIVVAAQADVNNAVTEADEANNRQEIIVTVVDGQLVVRPNPFTPNGDNRNDQAVFNIEELELSQPRLDIFDISGRKIRSIEMVLNNQLSWDGLDNNGQTLLPGVYLYVLQDGAARVAKGYVAFAR